MSDLDDLGTLFAPEPVKPPDNSDPHPVRLTVHPRYVDEVAREHEAEYEVTVEHPDTCSGYVEECPVADLLECEGVVPDFYEAWPAPDHLSDEALSALNGTVHHAVVTRHYERHSNPGYGEDWSVEWDFTWVDVEPGSATCPG